MNQAVGRADAVERHHAPALSNGCPDWLFGFRQYRHWRGDVPGGAATGAVAGVLRHALRHRRNQQLVLRTANGRNVHRVAAARTPFVHLCGQGQPLPDPHEEVARSRPLRRRSSSSALVGGRDRGPVLYQLPPHWRRNLERLELLRALPRRRLHAVEFRDPSWYSEDTLELLHRYRVTLCVHDMAAGSGDGVNCSRALWIFASTRDHCGMGGFYRILRDSESGQSGVQPLAARGKPSSHISTTTLVVTRPETRTDCVTHARASAAMCAQQTSAKYPSTCHCNRRRCGPDPTCRDVSASRCTTTASPAETDSRVDTLNAGRENRTAQPETMTRMAVADRNTSGA